jgi:hypothetical protein
MTRNELIDSICEALNNLSNWDVNCFDYWVNELYDGDDEVWNNWTEENLALMEKDVMYAFGNLMDESRAELIGK